MIGSYCGGGSRSLRENSLPVCIGALVARMQLSAALIFADHYLGRITAFVTILAVCLLNLALWIGALVAYFANSPYSRSPRLTHSGRSEVRGPSRGLFARCLETFWLAMPSRLTHSGRSEVRDPTHGLFARCLETFWLRLAMSSYPASNCGSLIGSLIVVCCLFSGLWHGHIRGLQ